MPDVTGAEIDVSIPQVQTPPGRPAAEADVKDAIMTCVDVQVLYSGWTALKNVDMEIPRNQIAALIGPSGCGKSTLLRCFNRMNDLIEGAEVRGRVTYEGIDIYEKGVDPVEVRRHVGMVFQKPNPFPKSIYENIAFGLRVNGLKDDMDDRVEEALKGAAIWDEVKNNLKDSALGLSGGQQQRLCIARTIAVKPHVVLMDEPCSALDPISTARIEDLMRELRSEYTIIIVTHNMQQAARVSDFAAFFTTELHEQEDKRTGMLVEYDVTDKIFTNPSDERTENYITGRFG